MRGSVHCSIWHCRRNARARSPAAGWECVSHPHRPGLQDSRWTEFTEKGGKLTGRDQWGMPVSGSKLKDSFLPAPQECSEDSAPQAASFLRF